MNISLVSERYAKALFELAIERDAVDEVYNDSLVISETCEKSKELRSLLKSPIINSEKKLTIIREIFENGVHKLTLTYLLIMIRKRREAFIPEIATELIGLYKSYHNILTVHFKSPLSPDLEIRTQVLQIMKNYSKSDIDLKTEIDESLIGGFVLTWDDKQYDASIRREIDDMRKVIAKVNLYKKGF